MYCSVHYITVNAIEGALKLLKRFEICVAMTGLGGRADRDTSLAEGRDQKSGTVSSRTNPSPPIGVGDSVKHGLRIVGVRLWTTLVRPALAPQVHEPPPAGRPPRSATLRRRARTKFPDTLDLHDNGDTPPTSSAPVA